MALTATVARSPVLTVKVSPTGGLQQTSAALTIQSISKANRLDTLADVDASGEVDGGFLTYDAATDKYVIRRFQLDPAIVLDGGSF